MPDQGCESACGTMEACEGCASNPTAQAPVPMAHDIKKIIAVASGKGGVGKSMVTALLATMLQRQGKKVGLLDADITGASSARMFGVSGGLKSDGQHIIPKQTASGILLMSINLMLDHEEDPVVWRGPILADVVTQFYTDVAWGDLDVLLIDMPPGTGDIPITIYQNLPVDGTLLVTTPQDLVSMIVKKAVNMAGLLNIPMLGIIENMSYIECPDCEQKLYPFGESDLEALSKEIHTEAIARLPIDTMLSKLSDQGSIEKAVSKEMDEAALWVSENVLDKED